jgi:hypothetical protein
MTVFTVHGQPNIGQQGVETGIRVSVHADNANALSPPATALAEALSEVNGSAISVADAVRQIPNHDVVHVYIGKKP